MGFDIWNRPPQRVLSPSPFCPTCPAGEICQEQFTELGCHPDGAVHPALLHPHSPDFLERVREINGFRFDYPALAQEHRAIPEYVPAVRPTGWQTGSPGSQALAIPLSHVERLARRVRRSGKTAKQLLGLAESETLIVLGFANDAFLEKHWIAPQRQRLLLSIKYLEPDMAIAWNYSVWHRHSIGWANPRLEHLYNMKRSLKIYAHLQKITVPAIPHIYWGLPDDLDLWATWLRENPCVTMIAIDLQTVDGAQSWQSAVKAIAHFRSLLSRPVGLFVSGVCQIDRISELRRVWPGVFVSNMGAYFTSGFVRYKQRFGLQCQWQFDPDNWSRMDIFNDLVQQYMTVEARDPTQGNAPQPTEPRMPSLRVPATVPPASNTSITPKGYGAPMQLRLWDDTESVA